MSRALAVLVAFVLLSLAGRAHAQNTRIPDNDWRQGNKGNRAEVTRSPQNFAFEIRFGPYFPEVDEEFGLGFGEAGGPYAETFGERDDRGELEVDPQFYFGLEVDWQAVRIPWVGAVGPGFGWGFTTVSAPAKIQGTDIDSAIDTRLTIMPMHLSAVVRFDEVMRRTGVPIVPYGKIGLGMATWSTSGAETSVYTDPATNESVEGEGLSWGMHLALGGMLSLNWIDPGNAVRLDEATGVNHAYLFGEWMWANLDGIGGDPQMHVGSSTVVVGLAFDM